jgi:hypothetical protein
VVGGDRIAKIQLRTKRERRAAVYPRIQKAIYLKTSIPWIEDPAASSPKHRMIEARMHPSGAAHPTKSSGSIFAKERPPERRIPPQP